jgi:hypothetical protein
MFFLAADFDTKPFSLQNLDAHLLKRLVEGGLLE